MFTPDTVATNPPLVYYFHTDHLDTPRVVTDTSSNLRWRWLAEPFGTTAPETNPASLGAFTQNLRFPGQYADQETGLSYNLFRDFDSSTGRYVQSDPIGLGGGINTYAYVEGNPLSYVDPNGLVVQLCRRPVNIDWVGGASAYLPNHNWIRTDSTEAGMGGVCPIPGQGCSDTPGVQTQTINHAGQGNSPGAVCVTVPDVDEQCVNKAISPGQATGRWMPWNQCQSFARETLYNCSTLGPTTPYIGYPNVNPRRKRP